MTEKDLLFDASSLIYALKLRKVETLYDNYIQWLTIYEVINALWKEAILTENISVKDATDIINAFCSVIDLMKLLTPHPHEQKIFTIAKELKITTYDASYIFLAKKHNLLLVTEDKKLKERAKSLVNTANLSEIIH